MTTQTKNLEEIMQTPALAHRWILNQFELDLDPVKFPNNYAEHQDMLKLTSREEQFELVLANANCLYQFYKEKLPQLELSEGYELGLRKFIKKYLL